MDSTAKYKHPFQSKTFLFLLFVCAGYFLIWLILSTAATHRCYLIYGWIQPALKGFLLLDCLFLLNFCVNAVRSGAKGWLAGAFGIAMLVIYLIGTLMFQLVFCGSGIAPYIWFTSPSGSHRVVVLEQGFVDDCYYAYPIRFGIFYEEQDNGAVFRHGFSGGASVMARWETEERAVITIYFGEEKPYGETSSGNSNGEIVVEFH